MANGDEPLRHPRITKAYARSLIDVEKIIIDHDMSVVICLVKLKSEHRVIGTAIVANRNTFEEARGTKIARDKVIDQIIQSEMYQLRSKIHEQKQKEVSNAD